MRLAVGGKRAFVSTGSGYGAADAPGVVFIHGAGHDHTVWVMCTRYFARHGYRVCAPDLPGHGRSDGPPLASIGHMAEWIAAVMDACDLRQAAVVGHSMGSLVAYELARTSPERCRTLTLLGTSVPMPVTHRLLDAAADDHHAAIDMANNWSHGFGRLGANDNPGMWMLGGGQRLIERARAGRRARRDAGRLRSLVWRGGLLLRALRLAVLRSRSRDSTEWPASLPITAPTTMTTTTTTMTSHLQQSRLQHSAE